MKMGTLAGAILLVISSTGCAAFGEKKVDPNFQLQMQTYQAVEIARSAQIAATAESNSKMYTAALESCTDDTCRVMITQSITMQNMLMASMAGNGGNGQQQQMPTFQKPRSNWITAADFALRLIGIAAPEWRMDRQAKYSTETSLAQYQFLGGVIRDTANAAVQMQPSITVGGHYNTGQYTEVEGGYIGGNATGPGAGIGNTYAQDNSTRTSGNYNNVGDANRQDNSQGQINGNRNRLDSPDNIDQSDNRNCAAGPGAPGGFGTSEAGMGTGGDGAPGGSVSCN